MSKILVYIGSHDNNSICDAIERLEAGDEVLVIRCDRSMGICRHNMYGAGWQCRYCEVVNNNLWYDRMLKLGATIKGLKDIITKEDRDVARDCIFDYNDVDELKAVKYKGVEVGYGAFSTYVTLSRNVMPDFTPEFKKYIDYTIRKEIAAVEAIDREIIQFKPDWIYFHNGRFAEFKPILGLTQKYNIPFVSTEEIYRDGKVLKDDFVNDVVHSVQLNYEKVLKDWELGKETEEEKKAIAKKYYEDRANRNESGGTVYVGHQEKGKLPEGFDKTVENITIFNSSEDEFCSVSSEFDNNMLFKNQYTALKTLFEHYKEDKTKHFYLRIHPNLREVPYRAHMMLYDFHYDNVTVIPANSPIDSYVLMFHSDKIITFNSLMSMESSYWGKPVITLIHTMWNKLGVVYTPNNEDEIWALIDQRNLPCLKNDNIYKFPYRRVHSNSPEENKIRFEKVDFHFLVKHFFENYAFYKFLGSYKLNVFIKKMGNSPYIRKLFRWAYKFDELPCTINS